MTFEEFLSECMLVDVAIDMNLGGEYERYSWPRKLTKPGRPGLSVTWSTGGVGGGSCWDDGSSDNHYALSGEEEPEFTAFETLVLTFVPNITFADFRELRRQAVKFKEWTEYEYYGNSTSHAEKYVYLEDIYNFLNDKGYLNES